jgi:rSAM/selenodomain-associated transferase 2
MSDIAVSVIIPTLNEEESLVSCLGRLRETGVEECIVVDGGSRDATKEVALSHNVNFLITPGGRAAQSNAGAALARGRILCFLHADTRLPLGWHSQILDVVEVQGRAGGAFRFGLRGDRPVWRIIEAGVNWRSKWLGLPYGDQALFVRREVFASLSGFKHMPFMEDVDFVFRLKRLGSLGLAPGRAETSPRKWEKEGALSTTLGNYSALLGYILGIKPSTLYRWYARSRTSEVPKEKKASEGVELERPARVPLKGN